MLEIKTSSFHYPFVFLEEDSSTVEIELELEKPLPCSSHPQESGFYRPGRIHFQNGHHPVEVVLYHNPATAQFIYLHEQPADAHLLRIAGLKEEEIPNDCPITLPGQLCLGAARTALIGKAMQGLFSAPPLRDSLQQYRQEQIAIFPIAREGLKYQIAEALFDTQGYYCDEIILDAHHVFDHTVPLYNRKVEMTLFKDKDLDPAQRNGVKVAIIGDSIASGLVMREVIEHIRRRFPALERVEVVAPLATVRGLTRLARTSFNGSIPVRAHVFETLLNALPPDYYYSAHFNIPELHIRPDLEQAYRQWWGMDATGQWIADTACAGYGWSEVFYSPRKQIQMINEELHRRHGLTLAEILRRNLQ